MGQALRFVVFNVFFLLVLSSRLLCAFSDCEGMFTDKTLRENMTFIENSIANISSELPMETIKKGFVDIKVCEAGKPFKACRCRWSPDNSPTCKIERNDTTCYVDISEISIMLPVRRMYSGIMWELLGQNSMPVVLKHTQLYVTYSPQITQISINGERVYGSHVVITENKEVNVSCAFINGNPPVSIFMVNDTEQTLCVTNRKNGLLTQSLGVYDCHDGLRTIRCEAPGSKVNRSVAILVQCPPRLSFMNTEVVTWSSVAKGVTLALKSYTRNITKCLLTKMYSKYIFKNVTCEISGNAPEFNLTLRPAEELSLGPGNWTLRVSTKFGDTNITFEIINQKNKNTPRRSNNGQQSTRTTILITFGCLLSIITSSFGILFLCVLKTSRQNVWARCRRHLLGSAIAKEDNMNIQHGSALRETDNETIGHADHLVSSEAQSQFPCSDHYRTDELIYGELDFSDITPSNVIIGSLTNTQYAEIQLEALVHPSLD